jgi:hypothetical protein|mmetsp:Transcript_41570/g.70116  ORF Transcript_41570/g.70116 Transcript_41570/m.70116 type:complete len:206 (+) Transcript_41570:4083-4700(+)
MRVVAQIEAKARARALLRPAGAAGVPPAAPNPLQDGPRRQTQVPPIRRERARDRRGRRPRPRILRLDTDGTQARPHICTGQSVLMSCLRNVVWVRGPFFAPRLSSCFLLAMLHDHSLTEPPRHHQRPPPLLPGCRLPASPPSGFGQTRPRTPPTPKLFFFDSPALRDCHLLEYVMFAPGEQSVSLVLPHLTGGEDAHALPVRLVG